MGQDGVQGDDYSIQVACSAPTAKGGTLLVDSVVALTLALPADDLPLSDALPDDPSICGVAVDLQAIELDAGAAHGLSFTAGLELVIGN